MKKGIALVLFVLMVAVSSSLAAPQPIIEYLFNETGTEATSSGAESISLNFYNAEGATDLHSTEGGGVSGQPGDRSFNNNLPHSGVAEMMPSEKLNPALSAFKSATWQGWFKFDKEPGNGSRIFDKYGNNYQVYYAVGGSLLLNIMNEKVRSENAYKKLKEWVYFAVTYDNTKSEDNVSFYVGTKTQPVELVSTHTLNVAMRNNSMNLKIGGWSTTTARFTGHLDNIRLFGSKLDDSGVLSLEELEELRTTDLVFE